MQNSNPRSGSSENSPKGSVPSPRSLQSQKSSGALNYSPESNAGKMFDKKPQSKLSNLSEKRNGRTLDVSQHVQQLQEELRRARDERTRALEDLEELRSNKKLLAHSNKEEMEVLEKKVEKAKESEKKMLESLIYQTKQLEQTKILLEEAKLEAQALKDSIKTLDEDSSRNNRENVEMRQNSFRDLIRAQEEIVELRNELKLAIEAEEKSKKAMDDLAMALKEVTTEANQTKTRLSTLQSEFDKLKLEAERPKPLGKITDDKLRAMVEESEKMKQEAEDLISVWQEKENGLLSCMKVSEDELAELKLENSKLRESLKGAREETSKLRDIVKHAVNESTVVKDALEIVRTENSQLQDLLAEKETSLQNIKQEYECLKVSEAAATDSVKELKGFIAASSTVVDSTLDEVTEFESKKIVKSPSYSSLGGDTKISGHSRRHSVAVGPGMFRASTLRVDTHPMEHKERLFSSYSNVSQSRVPSSIYDEDRETPRSVDFDHIAENQLNGTNHEKGQKKKKHMLKRFGEMLRRRSFHR